MAQATQNPKGPATAGNVAATADSRPGLAATPTGKTGGKSQKLAYAAGDTKLRVVPSAATGSGQKLGLQAIQAVVGKAKAITVDDLLAGLQANKVPNPRRIYRRAVRAGVLVTA